MANRREARDDSMKAGIALALILTWLAAESLGCPAIYQWQDPEGKVYFTDNPTTIPTEYWNQILRDRAPTASSGSDTARSTRVQVERTQKAVLVPAVINGRLRIPLFLDTGSTYCQITHEDARALALQAAEGPSVKVLMADGRSLNSTVVTLESLTIGSFEIRGVEALVGDLRLLGLNVLQRFRVTLDLPRGEIILESPP